MLSPEHRPGGIGRGTRFELIPRRRDEPELMDAPGLPVDEVADAYRVLQRVNRQFFGGQPALRRELDRFLNEERVTRPGQSVRLLDVGSGSGDLPRFASGYMERAGIRCAAVALDRDPTALALASRADLAVVRADALRLPFPDRSMDVVTAVKFAHHFTGSPLARLLAEMARVASRRVIVLDIRRHWLAYWGFVIWSRACTRNRLVHHDGPLSVLRGFRASELAGLAVPLSDLTWSVRRHPGFQLALIGRRPE